VGWIEGQRYNKGQVSFMVIALNPEQAQMIDRAIETGVIQGPEDVIELGVQALRSRMGEEHEPEPELSAKEWSRRLHAWANSHPTDTPLLSDEAVERESIYGYRGLE
jgi:hypothetical protein